jgi:hypothetical protein
MAINIPKLLPLVRQQFPNVPLPKLLTQMNAFSKAHPKLNDAQAIQVFQTAMQHPDVQKKLKQPQQPQAPMQNVTSQVAPPPIQGQVQ